MALSNAQKTEIQKRANAGESGSSLAKEFGVSASAISVIKNHYVPEATAPVSKEKATKAVKEVKGATKTLKVKETVVKAKEETKASNTRVVVIMSSKQAAKEYTIPANASFGEMLTIVGESNVSGILQGVSSSERQKLQKSTDKLPDTKGAPLHIYLTPVKVNSGF